MLTDSIIALCALDFQFRDPRSSERAQTTAPGIACTSQTERTMQTLCSCWPRHIIVPYCRLQRRRLLRRAAAVSDSTLGCRCRMLLYSVGGSVRRAWTSWRSMLPTLAEMDFLQSVAKVSPEHISCVGLQQTLPQRRQCALWACAVITGVMQVHWAASASPCCRRRAQPLRDAGPKCNDACARADILAALGLSRPQATTTPQQLAADGHHDSVRRFYNALPRRFHYRQLFACPAVLTC
jgi:hypothetical protein